MAFLQAEIQFIDLVFLERCNDNLLTFVETSIQRLFIEFSQFSVTKNSNDSQIVLFFDRDRFSRQHRTCSKSSSNATRKLCQSFIRKSSALQLKEFFIFNRLIASSFFRKWDRRSIFLVFFLSNWKRLFFSWISSDFEFNRHEEKKRFEFVLRGILLTIIDNLFSFLPEEVAWKNIYPADNPFFSKENHYAEEKFNVSLTMRQERRFINDKENVREIRSFSTQFRINERRNEGKITDCRRSTFEQNFFMLNFHRRKCFSFRSIGFDKSFGRPKNFVDERFVKRTNRSSIILIREKSIFQCLC